MFEGMEPEWERGREFAKYRSPPVVFAHVLQEGSYTYNRETTG